MESSFVRAGALRRPTGLKVPSSFMGYDLSKISERSEEGAGGAGVNEHRRLKKGLEGGLEKGNFLKKA